MPPSTHARRLLISMLVVAIALTGCGAATRHRSTTAEGDACAAECELAGGDGVTVCLDRCPGVRQEAGECADSDPGRYCKEERRSRAGAVVVAITLTAAAVFAGLLFLAASIDFH